MINIAVCGSNGKMGQEVVKAVKTSDDMNLVAEIDILNGQFATIKEAKDSVKIVTKLYKYLQLMGKSVVSIVFFLLYNFKANVKELER